MDVGQSNKLEGIFTPLLVPLDDRGRVNEAEFRRASTSTEQNPIHQYKPKPGKEGIYTVILYVTGPAVTSRKSKAWEVHVRG